MNQRYHKDAGKWQSLIPRQFYEDFHSFEKSPYMRIIRKYMRLKTLTEISLFEAIEKVLAFGAKKYEPHSWIKLDDGINRYYYSLRRHERKLGEIDPESKLPHLYHLLCNAMFLHYLWRKEQ